jgi:hypothetical protein
MFGQRRKSGFDRELKSTHHSIVSWEHNQLRTAIVALGEGTAELLGIGSAPVFGISRTGHPDVERWHSSCEKALSQAEEMTQASCGRKVVPDHVTMSIPAEITRSLPILVSRDRRKLDEAVTEEELLGLLQRGYRKAQDIANTQSKTAVEDIICGSVVQVAIDRQVVLDPLGLHGDLLELKMHFTLAPTEWIRALEIVSERLQLGLVSILPQHIALCSPLPDAMALLILLDEQHTHLSMVRYGCVEWSGLIEIGERQISGATAEALALRGRQADALMRAYRARQLRQDIELELARAFWIELQRWMRSLAENAKRNSAIGALMPASIYFLDMTRRMPEAGQALQTPFWEGLFSFERCPVISELGPATIREVVDCTAQAGSPDSLSLRALANRVAQVHGPGGLLEGALLDIVNGHKTGGSWRSP